MNLSCRKSALPPKGAYDLTRSPRDRQSHTVVARHHTLRGSDRKKRSRHPVCNRLDRVFRSASRRRTHGIPWGSYGKMKCRRRSSDPECTSYTNIFSCSRGFFMKATCTVLRPLEYERERIVHAASRFLIETWPRVSAYPVLQVLYWRPHQSHLFPFLQHFRYNGRAVLKPPCR